MASSDYLIDPPNGFIVDGERPVLYRADGTPLKRQIGFAMTQTTGTFPQLTKPGARITGKPKKGKK